MVVVLVVGGRALAFSLGMARVVSPGLFAWGWGRAPTPRQSANLNELSPGVAISPMLEVYTSICRIHTIISASRGCHTLQILKYEAVLGVKGRSPFNY